MIDRYHLSEAVRQLSAGEYDGGGHGINSVAAAIRHEPRSQQRRPCTRLELSGGSLPGGAPKWI
jgi:hypothetical protein